MLDRAFSSPINLETYCIICGARKFHRRGSEIGVWLTRCEKALQVVTRLGV